MNPFRDIKDWSDVNQINNFLETHSVDTKDDNGETPLHRASYEGYTEVVQILLEHRAKTNVKNNKGDTPLHLASQWGYIEIAKILIENSAKINVKDGYRETPLHSCLSWIPFESSSSEDSRTEVVKILISHGAKINVKDNIGQTPLHYASQRGYTEVVKILISHGAKINVKNNDGQTPLHIALENNHINIAKILIEHGADMDIKDNNEKTPLYLCSIKGIKKIFELFLSREKNIDYIIKSRYNMINKIKTLQTACLGIEILEFISEVLYPYEEKIKRIKIIEKELNDFYIK